MPIYKDKVIIVTGASSGIGQALCLALAHQGPRLVLAARDEARLNAVAEVCQNNGAQTTVVPTDIASEKDCARLIARAVEEHGGLDVLVNNAGVSMIAPFETVKDLSIYETLIKTNYLGAVYATYYALPHLKKSRGQIVAVASIAGLTGVPTRTGYSASKHALIGFFDSLRIELHDSGISVTIVAPDFVLSEIHRRSFGADGKALGKSPLQESKIMTAGQCAALIVPAMEKRQRLLITSWRGKLGRWLRLPAPGLLDTIAHRAIREGR